MRTWGCMLVLAAVAAGGTEEGKAALAEKDYERALELFKEAGEAGDAEAQFQAGELYRQGLGMRRANPRYAKKWYEKAQEQGHAGAAGELGIALWDKKKWKRKKAVELIREGAEAGHTRSAYYLAKIAYRGSDEVELSDEEMYALFRRTAEQGHPDAQEIYGSALRNGTIGDEKKPAEAERWLRKAAAQGHPDAFAGVAHCLLDRMKTPGGGTNMGAMRGGIAWMEKAALRGVHSAQHFVALAQMRSHPKESYVWATIGADRRYSRSKDDVASKVLQKGYVETLRDHLNKVKQFTSPEDIRAGDDLIRKSKRQIREHLAKPLPWQEPER